uniref:Uncharacterized protein n=1 Tax=Gasterosteus aculeatus aculeatus TaxID=481459 RepID=A0AAQ4PAY5_GASAC
IGTLGQWMRKMKMASRLTRAHIMQKRMMPRQRRKVPPPPAGTTMYPKGGGGAQHTVCATNWVTRSFRST